MTDNFEKKVAVDGPVVNAGELGSSTFSPGQALPAGPLGLGQRWTVARKREVVLRLLRDEPVQLLSRQLGVEIFRLEQWREKAIGGIDASLKQRKGDPVQAELDSAMKRRIVRILPRCPPGIHCGPRRQKGCRSPSIGRPIEPQGLPRKGGLNRGRAPPLICFNLSTAGRGSAAVNCAIIAAISPSSSSDIGKGAA